MTITPRAKDVITFVTMQLTIEYYNCKSQKPSHQRHAVMVTSRLEFTSDQGSCYVKAHLSVPAFTVGEEHNIRDLS